MSTKSRSIKMLSLLMVFILSLTLVLTPPDSICFTHYFGADYADRIFLFRLIDSPQVTQFCMDGAR